MQRKRGTSTADRKLSLWRKLRYCPGKGFVTVMALPVRPTFVNVSSSRGVSAVGIQVLSSSQPNPSLSPVPDTVPSGVPQEEADAGLHETLPLERQSTESLHTLEKDEYSYNVKIFNPQKKSKFVVRQLHHHSSQFMSVTEIKEALSEELDEEVPDVEGDYSIGYFEGRHQKKRWLANGEDVTIMYQKYKKGAEIFLWCDGREDRRIDKQTSKHDSASVLNKRQMRDDEIDATVKELKKKHGDTYTTPQLRLWARMIASGTHDDMDDPPRVPMITGAPIPKKQKQESMTSALVDAATAFAKVLCPSTSNTSPVNSVAVTPATRSTPVSNTLSRNGVSPSKLADVRMKNLEQLRCMKKLMDDGVLSHEEFIEQKEIILKVLRDL